MIDLFICLFAIEGGGAIYTLGEAWIKFCKFGNNSCCNKEGNDVYAGILTIFYSLAINVNNVCSISPSPKRIVISNLV
jgi:hypothetical protein